jgi:uncharacterized protein YjbJ (UPF0337 family)
MKSKWKEQKKRLKQKFVELTEKDMIIVDGKESEMFKRLQIKLGKTKEQLQAIIAAL